MKFVLLILASSGLLIAGMHLTSCTIFTKSDAAAIGTQIATDSIALANQELNGQPVDIKAAVEQIGIKAVISAGVKIESNIATAQAPQTITAAAVVAQQQIAATAADNPLLAAKAATHAANAVASAQQAIASASSPSGK